MSTDHEAGLAVVRSTSTPIHDIGTAIYLSSDVFGWAAEWGWTNPFAFYFAGRGGMLGEVSADVVSSAFGWFSPTAVNAMYNEGVAVAGARAAAERMAACVDDPGVGQDEMDQPDMREIVRHLVGEEGPVEAALNAGPR